MRPLQGGEGKLIVQCDSRVARVVGEPEGALELLAASALSLHKELDGVTFLISLLYSSCIKPSSVPLGPFVCESLHNFTSGCSVVHLKGGIAICRIRSIDHGLRCPL